MTHRRASVLLLVALLTAGTAEAATRFDPDLRFRRIRTIHFDIYFHQGEEAVASRLARVAEECWDAVRVTFGLQPPARTHVVLADQADVSNGWATPLPYDTIVLTASWPAGYETIGHSDDWLRLVFTHEFTHIVHLDRSHGYARLVKGIFGRVPIAFPNLFQPTWEIEGLATYFESAVTGAGRGHAADFRAVEREPARGGATFPLSRANGGLIAWPGGIAPYAYGLGFQEYLAASYGRDRLGALADSTAGRIPYTGSRAYRRVFGRPLGTLWDEYQDRLKRSVATAGAAAAPHRLTREGFITIGPRIAAAACSGCPAEVVYSVRTPHEFPAIKSVPITGGTPRTLSRRYLGSTASVTRTRILFDQQDLGRNVGLYSDLYELDRASGRVRRLTTGARLRDPDLSPDGRTIAAVREHRGSRALVLATVGVDGEPRDVRPILDEPEAQYATPRWSPDGVAIAVERHLAGSASEIVVVTPATKEVRVVARGVTRATTPAWRPDAGAVIAAADVAEGPFNLFEFPLDGQQPARRLTNMPGGATWPAVTPDGRTLVFVGYTADGYDLFTQPYEPVESAPPPSGAIADAPAWPTDARRPASEVYSPWATLAPRSWTPLLVDDGDQTQAGVAVAGTDVLGYHAVSGAVLWRTSSPAAVGVPGPGSPDWSVSYAYDRWRPRWFVGRSRATSFLRGASAAGAVASTLREETIEAGLLLPLRRVQRTQRVLVSGLHATNTVTDPDGARRFQRLSARSGWSLNTAQVYGYSISPDDGLSLGLTGEVSGDRASRLTDASTVTADARAYLSGVRRHHVVAVRAAGGLSTGPRDIGRTFRLGGPASNLDVLNFGRGAMSLLRGFGVDAFAGRRIAVANLEYRWPLTRVERGAGTWPVFVRTLHAAGFVDVGHAWDRGFRWRETKRSIGAELSADVVFGYALPVTLTAGAGRGHDGAGRMPDGTTIYARIGRAF